VILFSILYNTNVFANIVCLTYVPFIFFNVIATIMHDFCLNKTGISYLMIILCFQWSQFYCIAWRCGVLKILYYNIDIERIHVQFCKTYYI
jgi:hypothetical protein